jgi:hypothetical protein
MIVDGGAHLDLFDLDDLLLLASLCSLLLLLVFEFPVVHQLGYGGLGFGRNLDEIEAVLFSDGAGFVGADFAVFVPVFSDQENGATEDFLIDARPVFGWSRGGR